MSKEDFLEYDRQIIKHPKSYTNKAKLIAKCAGCHVNKTITVEKYYKKRLLGPWTCKKCVMDRLVDDPVYCNRFRQLHSKPEYKARVHTTASRNKISKRMKELWAVKYDEWVEKRRTKKFRDRVSRWSKSYWKKRRGSEK